ncbi:RNA-binding cell elongation regulator Jag/EloR [Rhabdothermincola salaria]|uniref:RNA-binding cell elongation regulator Jag/EloR n=1 Tax=Rhabdothermincola salaria TaxID=2903142 RepID=UPI001E359393|nr:Jag N-terminal domain-containing protein [Rhabdothermincola salaria]
MEWVETTGKSLEEAKDAALDELGIADEDAEFEVLEEPKQGLFGRTRGEARVRARIRPTQPRPKVERRDRRKGKGRGGEGRSSRSASTGATETTTEAEETPDPAPVAADEPTPARPPRGRSSRGQSTKAAETPQGAPVSDTDRDVDIDTHTTIVTDFVTGLVDAFGAEGTVAAEKVDDDNVEVRVTGSDLGLLVGPKGATLAAVQELSRTVVHRQVPGTAAGRVRVDVAGYRQMRREALERFVQSIAEQVRESGVQKALEPMSPPDRKVVHDTVNEIDGVRTISEGEEPRRRVVIAPDD